MKINLSEKQIFALELSAGVAVGFGLGYFVGWKRAEVKFAKLSEVEIEQAKRYYGDIHEKKAVQDLAELVAAIPEVEEDDSDPSPEERYLAEKYDGEVFVAYEKAAKPYSPVPDYDELEKDEPVKHPENFRKDPPRDEDGNPDYRNINIFDDSPPILLDKENRDPLKPYIIDKDEFMANDPEFEQTTLTYYEGDDVLVDERDSPIQDKEKTVGETHLEQFGFASEDDNVVYVRNETLELDFEILHSDGKYTEEVLGFIEHSDRRPKIRKFRGDDE